LTSPFSGDADFKLQDHVEDRDSGAHSPVRGIDKALASTGIEHGSTSSVSPKGPGSPHQPTPKKLALPRTTYDLERACETVVLTPRKGELNGRNGGPVLAGSETLTLTLNDPENFDYAVSLLQNSSNLFDQV
jgi:hypothetical protein